MLINCAAFERTNTVEIGRLQCWLSVIVRYRAKVTSSKIMRHWFGSAYFQRNGGVCRVVDGQLKCALCR